MWAQWEPLLLRFSLRPPPGTHLILSVPGRYPLETQEAQLCGSNPYPNPNPSPNPNPNPNPNPSQAELYGYPALRRHLQALSSRPLVDRPRLIEYALSSMGQLEDCLEALLGVRPPGAPQDKHACAPALLTGSVETCAREDWGRYGCGCTGQSTLAQRLRCAALPAPGPQRSPEPGPGPGR